MNGDQLNQLYEKDFHGWCISQKNALLNKDLNSMDIAHLVEEIDSLVKSDKNALESYLVVLLMHMIKIEAQKDYPHKESWETSIRNSRIMIEGIIENNPSLKPSFGDFVSKAWPKARRKASKETGIDLRSLRENPFSHEEIMELDS